MNLYVFHLFLLALVFHLELADSKNILAVFPHVGKSHYAMYESYIENLAERGHTVTLLTWNNATTTHKNIRPISFGDGKISLELNMKDFDSFPKFFFLFYEMGFLNRLGQEACSMGLSNPKVKDLINSKPKFDLVVVEYFNSDCFAVFSHIFNAPLMGIFSSPPMPWHNDRMGNPDNPSYIVHLFSGYSPPLDFFSRVKNAFTLVLCKTYYKMFYSGATDKIIRSQLGKGIPKVGDIVTNTSLFLVNSHHSLHQARPLVPGVVEVGGLHVETPKKLPPDLDKYLSNSRNGVVYFSLGTILNETTMPEKKKKIFLAAFEGLSQNVLWKWREISSSGKSKNILTKEWLPQNDVLAHPNVKVFVTHGGLMGMMEAVTHGVPMIIIPFFGDQFHNAALISAKGSSIVLDYFTLTENKLSQALKTLLEDKRYAENAKRLAMKFKERPLSPMNTAMYWTEYVLKFKGALHLRPANVKLSWFTEYLLDVEAFVILVLLAAFHFGKKAIAAFKEFKKKQESQKKKK